MGTSVGLLDGQPWAVLAVAKALRSPNDATSHHDNGTAIERYDFHSELVYVDKKLPHGVKVYRTMNHDKTTRGLPSCATVDGWYLSLGGLPFWPVEFVHKGQPDIAAACDYVFVDWPEGKNIRDEVCVCAERHARTACRACITHMRSPLGACDCTCRCRARWRTCAWSSQRSSRPTSSIGSRSSDHDFSCATWALMCDVGLSLSCVKRWK